jgi:hypothetical protein
MNGLKGRKLGIGHQRAANNTNDFALFDRLEGEHPIATDGRLPELKPRVKPGLWKIGFHWCLFLLPFWLIEQQPFDRLRAGLDNFRLWFLTSFSIQARKMAV